MRILHIDDSVNTCDCCGKSNLKFTVAAVSESGELRHFGSVCVRKNTGKNLTEAKREIDSAQAKREESARRQYRAHPAVLALDAALLRRPRELVGKAARDYMGDLPEAARAAAIEIAQQSNVSYLSLIR